MRFIFGFQLSFQEWTQQMKDMLDARKRGDQSFREKDFKTAIDCYSQVLISSYFTCSIRSVPFGIGIGFLAMVKTRFANFLFMWILLELIWFTYIASVDSSLTLEQWCLQLYLVGEVYATYYAINQTQHYATRCKHNACIQIGQRLSTCSL